MTLRDLSKYYKLHEQLERNKEMLSSLTAASGLGAQALTGMPHARNVSDRVSDLVIEMEDLEQRIFSLELECYREKQKIQAYISKIHDDQIRMIFRLRFIHCMTWPQVADAVGGGNTATNVKLICYRYLKKKLNPCEP